MGVFQKTIIQIATALDAFHSVGRTSPRFPDDRISMTYLFIFTRSSKAQFEACPSHPGGLPLPEGFFLGVLHSLPSSTHKAPFPPQMHF